MWAFSYGEDTAGLWGALWDPAGKLGIRKKEIWAQHLSLTHAGILHHIQTPHISVCSHSAAPCLMQCCTAGLRVGKTMTQRFHALCRLLLPLLSGTLEDLCKDVYAEYKRFKDVCWISRDEARHEINEDLEAGSTTAALRIEQCFLGQVEEGDEAAKDRRSGNHKAKMLPGSRIQTRAGARDRGTFCTHVARSRAEKGNMKGQAEKGETANGMG